MPPYEIGAYTLLLLVRADYKNRSRCQGWDRIDTFSFRGGEASLWEFEGRTCLVIRGSNDWWDWVKNLTLFPGWMKQGASGRLYHRGMIIDAQRIWDWVKDKKIDYCTGHSRGGAIASIIGPDLDVPTVAFASPKVLASRQQHENANVVLSITLPGDPVTWVVSRYQRIGREYCLVPRSGVWSFRHGTSHYLQALRDDQCLGPYARGWDYLS